MDEEPPKLGAGASDHISALLRMGAGAIPVAGAAFSELITHVIPGVRLERIEEYLRWLTVKLQALTQEELQCRLQEPENISTFEEGGYQCSRAITSDRREQIASIVAHGISGDSSAAIEARRLLNLLSELDDGQIIILSSHLSKNMFDDKFHERHRHILTGPAVHMQSPTEDIDKRAVHELAKAQLISLGLLRPRYKKPKKGEAPEFDLKTGMVKASSVDLTPLGRLLLRRIGIAAEGEA